MSKKNVNQIIEAIGQDAIVSALGVSTHSVRHAKFAGSMPANWYVSVKDLCDAQGIDCPVSAFNFKQMQSEATQ